MTVTADFHSYVLEQLARFLGESRPVARAVFDNDVDFLAHDAAGRVDLLDRELFRIDDRGLGDGDGAAGRHPVYGGSAGYDTVLGKLLAPSS